MKARQESPRTGPPDCLQEVKAPAKFGAPWEMTCGCPSRRWWAVCHGFPWHLISIKTWWDWRQSKSKYNTLQHLLPLHSPGRIQQVRRQLIKISPMASNSSCAEMPCPRGCIWMTNRLSLLSTDFTAVQTVTAARSSSGRDGIESSDGKIALSGHLPPTTHGFDGSLASNPCTSEKVLAKTVSSRTSMYPHRPSWFTHWMALAAASVSCCPEATKKFGNPGTTKLIL